MFTTSVTICLLILRIQFSTAEVSFRDRVSAKERYTRQTIVEDANKLFEEFWEKKLSDDPEFATAVGVHTYNDKLTAQSPQAYMDRRAMLQIYVSRAYQLRPYADEGTLTRSNLDVFIAQYSLEIDLLRIGNQYFSVSYLNGPHVNMMNLLDYQPTKTSEDFENLIARYRAFPQQVDETIALLNRGIFEGLTLHDVSLKNLEKTYSSFDVDAEKSLFYEPFSSIPENIQDGTSLQSQAKAALTEDVGPGFRKMKEYIQNTYKEHTRSNIAANSLPNGDVFYQKILNFHTTSTETPEQIHQLGLDEMKQVIKDLGKDMSVSAFNEQIRNDASFVFSSSEEALDAYKDVLTNKIQPKLPLIFKNLPKAEIVITAAPEHLQGGPIAFYMPGSPDGVTKGTFYLDTSSLDNVRKYSVITLALHEGIPGHHLQVSYSMEMEGIPEFRKYVQPPVNNAFLEGWALYSEYLGNELGLYEDPYMLYGHLSQEIFRACRLVVDTGIHALGWTREQAVEYMVSNSAETRKAVENEIDRYVTWPGQACSYKYGEIKIKELRQKAESELGDKFDLKEFHDVVLRSNGPMTFIAQEVNQKLLSTQ